MASLWGDEFTVNSSRVQTKKVIDKVNKPIAAKSRKKALNPDLEIDQRLSAIYLEVDRILGSYKENTEVIFGIEEFSSYITDSIKNGAIAIDTETNNSLDPLTCKIMGLCIYTPRNKNAYIPVNHINRVTKDKLENQVTEEQIKTELQRLIDNNVKIIMHNGKFDYEVIKCTCDIELPIYWDTMIGARILNENERAGLKEQYITKIDSSIEKYDIEHLFEKVQYEIVDPSVFALYAATDAFMTYKLYEYQLREFSKEENKKLFNLFMTIEMPIVIVSAEMELTGICLDIEYAKRLSVKYHKLLDDCNSRINTELNKFQDKINSWKLTDDAIKRPSKKTGEGFGKSKLEQLEDPINTASTTQLSILLYDILGVEKGIDKKSPRGTGEEILKKIAEKYPELSICNLILEHRGLLKLINTYIDKLPKCQSVKDNRLHAHFNQIGADTGRFSSSDPNLQNIPSHNNEIRMMFTARPGYILVGSDFSQQEPRLLANYAKDENMINAYIDGKDLYAVMASKVYNNKYEDNKEFYPDGTMNPEGKKRRTNMKSLLLGLMYGRGTASIADQIKTHKGPATKEDIQEAQKITDDFFNSFPKVRKWIDKTQTDAKKNGYVEDVWGRRRRLPDIQLDKFEIKLKDGTVTNFNPLLGSKGLFTNVNVPIIDKYKKLCDSCRSKKDIDSIKSRASNEGVIIKDNGGFISQAERQCVNARVQGGAASMSKRAMIAVHNDKELKDLGFKLLIAVHDELIGECPIESQEEVKKRLSELMINSAKPECLVPMKCDADSFKSWYLDVYSSEILKEYNNLIKNKSVEDSMKIIIQNHSECTPEQLKDIVMKGVN